MTSSKTGRHTTGSRLCSKRCFTYKCSDAFFCYLCIFVARVPDVCCVTRASRCGQVGWHSTGDSTGVLGKASNKRHIYDRIITQPCSCRCSGVLDTRASTVAGIDNRAFTVQRLMLFIFLLMNKSITVLAWWYLSLFYAIIWYVRQGRFCSFSFIFHLVSVKLYKCHFDS